MRYLILLISFLLLVAFDHVQTVGSVVKMTTMPGMKKLVGILPSKGRQLRAVQVSASSRSFENQLGDIGKRIDPIRFGVESVVRQKFPNVPDNQLELHFPCHFSIMHAFENGNVDFEYFHLGCLSAIKLSRFKYRKLRLRNVHLAQPEMIKRFHWHNVVSISGLATRQLDKLPWWLMTNLRELHLDFDIRNSAPLSDFVLSDIPNSIESLSFMNGRRYEEQISHLLSRLGTGLKSFSIGGKAVPVMEPSEIASYFEGNSALKSMKVESVHDNRCRELVYSIILIASQGTTKLETLEIGCVGYRRDQIETIMESIEPSPRTKLVIAARSTSYADSLRMMITLGEIARERSYLTSARFPGDQGYVEITFGRFKPPSEHNHVEVQPEWLQSLAKLAEKQYSDPNFRTLSLRMFDAYFGEERGIQEWEHERFKGYLRML